MTPIEQLYKKVSELTAGIKQEFRNNGIVIPVRGLNGGIKLDDFTVTKTNNNTYTITDSDENTIVKDINLAHTAILLANDLALGKGLDLTVLENDKTYGYSLYEEEYMRRLRASLIKKKDWTRAETLKLKEDQAGQKSRAAKKEIIASFEKLRRLR